MAGGFSSSSSATTIETSPSLRITAICLLILANSLFAGWDIIIREFYALSPHPFIQFYSMLSEVHYLV